jgi:Gas vesicle protein
MSPPKVPNRTTAEEILGPKDASLLDIVDNLLNKGVVLSGDLTIGLAQIDLVYARVSLLLSAADRVLPGEQREFMDRHHARHELRARLRGQPFSARQAKRRRSRA